jgi:hypothetical protein
MSPTPPFPALASTSLLLGLTVTHASENHRLLQMEVTWGTPGPIWGQTVSFDTANGPSAHIWGQVHAPCAKF